MLNSDTMKKYLLILLVSSTSLLASNKDSLQSPPFFRALPLWESLKDDCDACGCSASGGSMGFASMLNNNFVGLRYFYQSYRSNDGLYTNSPWYDETFNTVQVWSRIPLSPKIQVSALLPYHFHERATATGKQNISGIGDVTVLGLYEIYQTKNDSATFSHKILLGVGVKAPLGKFDEANNGSVNPSYQLGTGSWDYLITADYVIKRKRFGLNTMVNYILKTENQKNYRFGNQTNYAATFFYFHESSKFTLVPQLGIAGEIYESNSQHGQTVRNTAGNLLLSKIGFEVGKNKFSLGANAMIPITQNLNAGNVEARYRWSINLNYAL